MDLYFRNFMKKEYLNHERINNMNKFNPLPKDAFTFENIHKLGTYRK